MPPRRGVRLGGPRGRGRGRYRERPLDDVVSQQREIPRAEGVHEEVEQNVEPPVVPGAFIREFVAALAEANLLNQNQAPRAHASDRALDAMREFRRLNPPQFSGEGGDFLAADHWLSEICKLFTALRIVEDDLRVGIVACQLVGEADKWWKSVLEARKDARRTARRAARVEEPDMEDITWAEFESLFESRYFPESYREQLRVQFERLEQGNMTVSEYAANFQTLSRYAPELVTSEDRKCRRFERGLHSSVKRLVVSQHKMNFDEIVECARSVELGRHNGVQEFGNPGNRLL